MRQMLPESANGPLLAGPPVGRIIHPGVPFEAERLVPGCVSLEDGDEDQAAVTDGFTVRDEAGEGKPPRQEDKPAAKGRASAKETRP